MSEEEEIEEVIADLDEQDQRAARELFGIAPRDNQQEEDS